MNALLPVRTDDQVVDGVLIKALKSCKEKSHTGRCKAFYDSIKPTDYNRFMVCPHGMAVYVAENQGLIRCFMCMRNKDIYDKHKAKTIGKALDGIVYNPVMSGEQLQQLIEYSIQNESECTKLAEKRSSLESISHEVKKLNAQIKDRADTIIQTCDLESDLPLDVQEKHSLSDKIKTIYVSSSVIQGRFTLLDYERNPQVLKSGATFDCNIYKKFHKMGKILSNYLGRKVPIRLTGSSYKCIRAYPSFEMIPLLIIDNAVKYSYQGNNVEIRFIENENDLIVEIDSYGPACTPEESKRIFEKGFRGENAVKTSDGSGIGLFFVKMLCDLHNIEISAFSDGSTTKVNDVLYSKFKYRLRFKDTYLL
ncbi:MAG: sensor histidine kinase [Oscillospiraceae bacterium]|nr:sensor histidine kinase [Oscillospiraceae bacterium]